MSLKRNLLLLALQFLLATGSVLFAGSYWNLPWESGLFALAGIGPVLYLIVRFPEVFLAAALFAPQWKTLWIFRRLNGFADLTALMLVCLAAGLLWRFLVQFRQSNS